MTESNGSVGSGQGGIKKSHPTRGKRYSPAIKQEILGFALENDVASATAKYGESDAFPPHIINSAGGKYLV